MKILLLVCSLYQVALVTADAVCAAACQTALSGNEFSGISLAEDYYSAICRNVLQVKSTFICMRTYCPADKILEGWKSLEQSCEGDGGVTILPWSIVDDVTEAEVSSWPILTYEDRQAGTSFNTSASVDQPLYDFAYTTMASHNIIFLSILWLICL